MDPVCSFIVRIFCTRVTIQKGATSCLVIIIEDYRRGHNPNLPWSSFQLHIHQHSYQHVLSTVR